MAGRRESGGHRARGFGLGALLGAALLVGCGGGSGGSSGGTVTVPPATTTPPPPTTPPVTPPTSPTPPVTGSAELTWTAPTQNEDGSALTNLAGYKVRYGQSMGVLDRVLDVPGAQVTRVTIDGLATGTWYFALTSYTNTGIESAPTGAVWKTI